MKKPVLNNFLMRLGIVAGKINLYYVGQRGGHYYNLMYSHYHQALHVQVYLLLLRISCL
jgi:hypothetical protein